MRRTALRLACVALSFACASCRSELSSDKLRELRDGTHARARAATPLTGVRHTGPSVASGTTGTARFARVIHDAFDADRALETVRFVDGTWRESGNAGFRATLAHVEAELRAAGFGSRDELRLEVIEGERERETWAPVSGALTLVEGDDEHVLHAFDTPEARDRLLLPKGSRAAKVDGPLVETLADAVAGSVLVADDLSPSTLKRAQERGVALVIAGDLASYNVDPSGRERHRDAIRYVSVRPPAELAVAQVSPRSAALLRAAARRGDARVRFTAQVERGTAKSRTLVATIVGLREPTRAIPILAHVQEPGACDNASGVAGVLEAARVAARSLETHALARPARSIAFVWGDEMEQSRVWLERSGLTPLAALAADMLGQSFDETGAVALLERMPDPGAVKVLPPDVHTAWGSSTVDARTLLPGGLNVVARSALLDVAATAGGWTTSEHPYEGGSDHQVFLRARVPALLFWHFPDWAYHTSADRMEHVDAQELRRTASVVLTCAFALADAQPNDLARYLESLRMELVLRVAACEEADAAEHADAWRAWSVSARQWLRELCLGDEARLPRPLDDAGRRAAPDDPRSDDVPTEVDASASSKKDER